MTDDLETIPLVEGEQTPPDVIPSPALPDDDPLDVYVDPDQGDMPDDLPAGSYEADRDDDKGAHDHPRGG